MYPVPENKAIGTGQRLAAMLLDHFFMCIIAMLFFIPSFILSFRSIFSTSDEAVNDGFANGPALYAGLLGLALYFCKDVVNGRSLAKRVLKLQVVKNNSDEAASPMQCFIRNLFCIIWPVEVVAAIANPQRRLGDLVAGTKLVPYNAAAEQPKPDLVKMLLPVILAYAVMVLLYHAMPQTGVNRPKFSPTSRNTATENELRQYLSDSLAQYGIPEVKVYDTVYNSKLQYVSVILRLNQNHIADEAEAMALQQQTERLIYTKIPEETITGRMLFVYRGTGQFQSREIPIGITIIR